MLGDKDFILTHTFDDFVGNLKKNFIFLTKISQVASVAFFPLSSLNLPTCDKSQDKEQFAVLCSAPQCCCWARIKQRLNWSCTFQLALSTQCHLSATSLG